MALHSLRSELLLDSWIIPINEREVNIYLPYSTHIFYGTLNYGSGDRIPPDMILFQHDRFGK
jgi:hypothetical protein